MPVGRRASRNSQQPSPRPATTPEGRESQLIAHAVDLAERQMLDGTASAQVITHYLKLGSSREKLEQERLKRENILLDARAEAMESAKRIEGMYAAALDAMRSYAGQQPRDSDIELEGVSDEFGSDSY